VSAPRVDDFYTPEQRQQLQRLAWLQAAQSSYGSLEWLQREGAAQGFNVGGFGTRSGSPSMERIVRPFLTIDSQAREAFEARPPLPGEDTEAFISWGKASNFIRPIEDPVTASPGEDIYDDLGGGGFNVQFPTPGGGNPEPGEQPDINLQELSRVTETVKVYDPEDEANWIEVQRITSIRFRSSRDGTVYRFVFNAWD
jgi:hypothetical protein